MKKQLFKDVAKNLLFDVKKNSINLLEEDFNKLSKKLNSLKKFNTGNLKPLVSVNEKKLSFSSLNSEQNHRPLKKELLLKNAPKKDKDFVLVNFSKDKKNV